MPSIRQSAKVNLSNWKPTETPTQKGADTTPPPPPDSTPGMSPMMLAPMPLMASTGDAFSRQFYGQGSTPQQRILPAKRGGGA